MATGMYLPADGNNREDELMDGMGCRNAPYGDGTSVTARRHVVCVTGVKGVRRIGVVDMCVDRPDPDPFVRLACMGTDMN